MLPLSSSSAEEGTEQERKLGRTGRKEGKRGRGYLHALCMVTVRGERERERKGILNWLSTQHLTQLKK